jgi:hypothetical protein
MTINGESLLVAAIVATAAANLIYRSVGFFRNSQDHGCGKGCGSCGTGGKQPLITIGTVEPAAGTDVRR